MNIDRLGFIECSIEFIETGALPQLFYDLKITPVETTPHDYYGIFKYKCISDGFSVVKKGDQIQTYRINASKKDDELLFKFVTND